METWQEGDFYVSRPCAKVARLNMLAMLDEHLVLFRNMMKDPRFERLQATQATKEEDVIFYMNQRRELKDNEDKRYVNFAEASDEVQLQEVLKLCKAWGLEEYVVITPSPLLRATRGVRISLTMPLSEGSTYQRFTTLLPEAEKLARPREREGGDPDFDLESSGEASYGNHSMREMADDVARQTMSETGATETDIDRMFGWCEAWYRKKMQLHYAGRDDRVKRAKITLKFDWSQYTQSQSLVGCPRPSRALRAARQIFGDFRCSAFMRICYVLICPAHMYRVESTTVMAHGHAIG